MSNTKIHKIQVFFEQRRIETAGTPADVLLKAQQVIGYLEQGIPYWRMKGKRLTYNRDLVSIPVGRKWRLLAQAKGGRLIPLQVLSHERYNGRLNPHPRLNHGS